MHRLFSSVEVVTASDRLIPYSRDESHHLPFTPRAVLFPKSTSEVSFVLKTASRERIAVIPRGAGSGLSGAAVPSENSVVLSLEKMNRLIDIDTVNRIVETEPGVITGDLRRAVEEQGLFYPPIPASVDFCSIGGNVATNAGGLCAVKYGVTREYVLGLEAVLMSGEIIRTGGRFVKNSTGYNLTQLLAGSEGTLAVITKITLKLIPFPAHRTTFLVPFPSLHVASQAVLALFNARITPPTLELLPRQAVEYVLQRHSHLDFPFREANASLLIELDGKEAQFVEADLARAAEVLEALQSAPPIIATTAEQKEKIWNVRKNVRDSISNTGPYEEADAVVPRNRVPDLVLAADEVAKELGLAVVSYGHAGDGNLHTYFLRGKLSDAAWNERREPVLRKFFEKVVGLGGTISGEHGIGALKREFMPIALSKSELDLMKRLKAAFDPNDLLNPGKVLP